MMQLTTQYNCTLYFIYHPFVHIFFDNEFTLLFTSKKGSFICGFLLSLG